MGLRTASLRRPYVAVMAPALTETTQPQALKLPPKVDHHHVQPASPLNGFEARGKFLPDVHGSTCFQEVDGAAGAPAVVASGANMSEEKAPQDDVVAAEIAAAAAPTPNADNITDNITGNNNVTLAMGQDEKNQQQQGALDVADFPQNVDELMQVIKSMESADAAVPESDLIDELPVGLDNLLAGVDMMDMSIEEDTKEDVKENQTKDLIVDLEKRQARLERRLDLMRRKVHKLQVRHMGQHASGEVAGVFEYVHRSLKRLKENESDQQQQQQQHALPPPLPEEDQTAISGGGGVSGGDNRPRPMTQSSAKALVKKLEMTAMWQANAAARQKHVSRYFGAGSLEPGRCGTVPGVISVPPWPTEHKQELYRVAGLLKAELGVLQREVDSEATDSSSGGESCDEMVNYSNPHQQYLSIQKRALWKFLTARAAIAAKWSWLQAQITDLEYRIRTYTEFHKQIRTAKGTVTLGGASPPRCNGDSSTTSFGSGIGGDGNTLYTAASPMTAAINGYKGQLPGATFSNKTDIGLGTPSLEISANGVCIDYQCARTRPLVNFRKRKLLQTNGLHLVSKKAARPSTVRCGCVPSAVPCALCTGRTDPTHPRDPTDALSKTERIALVDPTFHPVFSLHEDVSCGIHCDAIMKMPEWQQRSTRMKSMKSLKGGAERNDKAMLDHRSKALDHRKKYGRLKPSTASALSAKIKNKMRGRKPTNRHSSTAASLAYRINRKRSSAKTTVTQMQGLVTDGADEEVESIGNSSHAATNSALVSPSSSPLFHMQTISGYNRRNRANSYDIDNIVIPYSVAASTRVEKLQYKEILTPKWRIADTDFKCDTKNNGAVRNPSQDSDTEDLSEEAVVVRHDKSEYEEKKKFLSYLKLPAGHRGSRAHKRTDSLAESSGANTPDAMSPHPVDAAQDNAGSPLASPPATPLPLPIAEEASFSAAVAPPQPAALPSLAVMRRRTISQSRSTRDRDVLRDDAAAATPLEHAPIVEAVAPFDTRTFPLDEQLYAKMMESMPENSQLKTNDRARDSISDYGLSYLDDKADSPCSESTESAIGEEDPNDPEWVDMERSRDRHKR